MSSGRGKMARKIETLVALGLTDAQIVERLKAEHWESRIRVQIGRERQSDEAERAKHVPTVIYTRADGRRMWEVFPGHLIGEEHLEIFGYRILHENAAGATIQKSDDFDRGDAQRPKIHAVGTGVSGAVVAGVGADPDLAETAQGRD